MLSPLRVDALVDLTYGALITISVVLIAALDTSVGLAFGVGVFASYVVHVVWKMARFDPDWMTRTVQETVEETVEESVEGSVEEAVEGTVEEQLGEIQAQVDAVDERIDRRPREEEVEAWIEGAAEDAGAGHGEDG